MKLSNNILLKWLRRKVFTKIGRDDLYSYELDMFMLESFEAGIVSYEMRSTTIHSSYEYPHLVFEGSTYAIRVDDINRRCSLYINFLISRLESHYEKKQKEIKTKFEVAKIFEKLGKS
jgi:hypothetical protein